MGPGTQQTQTRRPTAPITRCKHVPTAFSALIHGHDGECPCWTPPTGRARRRRSTLRHPVPYNGGKPGRIDSHARGLAMSFSFLPVVVWSLSVFLGAPMFGAEPAQPAGRFEGKDTLLRPEGYREWVFVGSSLGLRYEERQKQPEPPEYNNVYIDPAAYRAYKQTGAF